MFKSHCVGVSALKDQPSSSSSFYELIIVSPNVTTDRVDMFYSNKITLEVNSTRAMLGKSK